jgi:ketosteroid isomerase-like protein
MSNLDRVKEITESFAREGDDRAVLDRFFAPEFEHWANGRRSDLKGYAAHLAGYRTRYESFRIPAWDELFAADDRVVAAYTLEAKTKGGSVERVPVMAIWRFRDGKVVSLRGVDARAA